MRRTTTTTARRLDDTATRRRGGDDAARELTSYQTSPRPRVSASPRPARNGGWTLIELIIVVTILSILTLGVTPLVKTSVRRQREQQLRESLREMREAIKEFKRDTVGMQCPGSATATATTPPREGDNRPPQPYIDPRSKVVISDCTIFGVDNLDQYPPTLQTLIEGVSVVQRNALAAMVNRNPLEGNATDNKLVSTKKKIYLRSIPDDPMTPGNEASGEAEWDLRSCYDEPGSSSWSGENVFDVRSKSEATALNEKEKYSEW